MSQLFTVKEASSFLKVHPNTVYKWTEERKIPFIRLNGLIRFSKKEIESWQTKNTSKIDNILRFLPKLDFSTQDYYRILLKGDSAGAMATKEFSREDSNQANPGASGTMRKKGRSRK